VKRRIVYPKILINASAYLCWIVLQLSQYLDSATSSGKISDEVQIIGKELVVASRCYLSIFVEDLKNSIRNFREDSGLHTEI
jgi:hypothetical protein